MGCFNCLTGDDEDKRRSKAIDRQLKADAEATMHNIKLLLLGAGESGKSTLLKQMRIIHDNGYGEWECAQLRAVIYSNTMASLRALVEAMCNLDIPYDSEENREIAVRFMKYSVEPGDELPSDLVFLMKTLWNDEGIQKSFERSSEYQLNDSAEYYLSQLERICVVGYQPTQADCLRTRIKTTGVVRAEFNLKGRIFEVYDVGGQRSERKKWIHCFEDVNAIIFCVAMSEYDKVMSEDGRTNRMIESLHLFNSICNHRYFVDTSIILFLNKRDLFAEKITRSPLTIAFPEYTGPSSYNEAASYVEERFEAVNNRTGEKAELYIQFTCATDTENCRFVFDAVTDDVIRNSLRGVGLY